MSIDHGDTNKSLGGKRTYTVEEIARILGIPVYYICSFRISFQPNP